MVSTLDAAKRVLVVLLRTLAATYNCAMGVTEQASGQAGSAPNAQVHPTCSPQAPKEPRRMAREGPHRQLDSDNDWPVVTRKQVDDPQ